MRPAQMNVRVGNDRRKKAAAALLAQMQSSGGATAGLGGVRQTGGLARAGAKAGIIRGQGRGIPAGLEALYARAGDFARQNQGGYQLNAEQQPGGVDPGQQAGAYAAANAPSDPGGQGGQQAGTPGAATPGPPAAPGLPQFTPEQQANVNDYWGSVGSQIQGMQQSGAPFNAQSGADVAANALGAAGPLPGGQPQDGQPMNGGVYFEGTIIPAAVWRAIQHGNI